MIQIQIRFIQGRGEGAKGAMEQERRTRGVEMGKGKKEGTPPKNSELLLG